MIPIPKLNQSILPYPPPKNYRRLLENWLKKNPWVSIDDGVMFPLETKVPGTKTHIKDGTIINGPMVIKGSGNVTFGKYGGIAENLYIISSNHKNDKNIDELEEKLDLSGEKETTTLDFSQQGVKDYLLDGWWEKETNLCWTSNKEATFFLKIQNDKKYRNLSFFGCSFYLSQKMSIIINRHKIGSILIKTEPTEYKIRVADLKNGINTIKLIFEHGFSPSSISQNTDKRILFAQFKKIFLSK